jgi:hypothetical protein
MTSPEQADVEASREAFLAGKGTPGSDYHLTLLMAPFHLNLVVGEDRKSLLAYARKVWGAALASVALESQGAGSDEIASLAGLAASSGVPPDSGQMLGAADQDVSEVLRPNEKEGQGAVALHPQPPDVHLACPQEHAAAAREADERSLPHGWISVEERLPEDETPVLIYRNGAAQVGELRWESPGWEDTFHPYRYWDDPHDDGQDWEWHSITHWMPLPAAPTGVPQDSEPT